MLNRFRPLPLPRTIRLVGLCLSLLTGFLPARAAVPTVVATSTTAYLKSSIFGYVNKVIVDPYGNVYATDSSNGAIYEIPVGSSTPIRINTFPLYASVGTPGSGYTSAPTVTFSAPPVGGVQATAYASINAAGAVSSITITNHGSGYTTTPTITLAGGGGSGAVASTTISLNATHGFTVDQYGDLIISNATSGNLYFFPYINGQLCTTCNAAGNEPLDLTGTYGFSTLDDYYGIVADVATDNNGNLYVAMSHCNNSGQACGTSNDSIFLIPNINPSTTASTIGKAINGATLFQGALPGGKAVLNMTADTSGHLYYVDGVNAYVVSTASPNLTPVTIGTGYKAPSGISLDAQGNLYVVDNSAKVLFEIPNENGSLNPADQFVVAALINPYYSVGFDHAGNIYQADGADKVINLVTLGALNFPAVAVGGTPVTANVNFRFNAAVTPAAFSIVQGNGGSVEFTRATGSTCVAGTTYSAAQSCLIAVTFTPTSTGVRQGAVVMQTAGSKAISTAFLGGVGSGPALTVDPGTQSSLTPQTAFKNPTGIAMDAAGNIYVSDAGSSSVQAISANGTAVSSVGSGLSAPGGVAVDGAGNVYVADTGNNRVVVIPNEGGTLNTADQTVAAFSGLSAPSGIAVDPAGALYVADTGNARVLRLQGFSPSGIPLQTTLGTGYNKPVSLTTDDNGNVFIADIGAGQIVSVNVQTYAQATVLSNLISPSSVGLDAAGDLYVVQSGTGGTVQFIPNVAGVLNTNGEVSLGSGLKAPIGVAVNGSGNLAIVDAGALAAYMLRRTAGALAFGSWNMGLTSDSQLLILTDTGTSTLTFGATPYLASGSTAGFVVTSPSSVGCSAGLAVPAGTTCQYSAAFAPVATGSQAETLTFSSNAVNGTSQTALLTGIGTNLALTSTTLTQTLPTSGIPQYGQAVTLTAVVATQAAGGQAPTGTVQFFVDGLPQDNPVSLSASLSAVLNFPAFSLSAGTHTITAVYSGDTVNSASDMLLILQVTRQTSAVTPSVFPLISQPSGSSFTLSATVAATLPLLPGRKLPTGTVTFVAAGSSTVLGTAIIQTGGLASFSSFIPPASGQYQLLYSGDPNYSGSSATFAVSIRNPGYDLSIPTAAVTVAAGQSVVVPITVTWISGYKGNIALGALDLASAAVTQPCSNLPQYVTCVFSPGIVSPVNSNYPISNPTVVVNLTIATNVPPASPYPTTTMLIWPGGLGLTLLSLLSGRRRKNPLRGIHTAALAVATFGLALAFSGCGSGSSAFVTPKGTSAVTVTFSGTPVLGAVSKTNPNLVNSVPFQLTVQ